MLGIGSLTARVWFLKISLCRVIRISDVIICAEIRLRIAYWKHIDRRCVGCRARLSLYLLKAQVIEDLFDYILMFYEGNYPHGPLAL